MVGFAGPDIFLSFNPNWGNFSGVPAQWQQETVDWRGLMTPGGPLSETITRALEDLGAAILRAPSGAGRGTWSDLKPSLGSGPLESGVFDRPLSEVPAVLPRPVERGSRGVSTPITRSPTAADVVIEGDGVDWGGGFEPGGIWDSTAREPDFETEEDAPVAIDWGQVVSGAIDIAQGQIVGGSPSQSFVGPPVVANGSAVPRSVTVDTRTGEVRPCRRRRRRRLLTPTDLSDLAALAAVVGKGDALKLAVAKAVRR